MLPFDYFGFSHSAHYSPITNFTLLVSENIPPSGDFVKSFLLAVCTHFYPQGARFYDTVFTTVKSLMATLSVTHFFTRNLRTP